MIDQVSNLRRRGAVSRFVRAAVLTSGLGRSAKTPIRHALGSLGYELTPLRGSQQDFIQGLIGRQEIDLLVDVGANQGQYARRFREGGFSRRMISFEPIREAFDRLARDARSDGQWIVRQVALGERPASMALHVSANSVSSSLLPIGPLHLDAEPASRSVRTETVRVSTLDIELGDEAPGTRFWLKLDVQGYEKAVLDGGPGILSRTRVVQCEVSTRELYEGQAGYLKILEALNDAGFTLVYLLPGFSSPDTGEMLQFDVIMARLERA